MMRGTAVVASAVDGLNEIVRHGQTGFLVPPDDAGALAEKLLILLRDKSLCDSMGSAGHKIAVQEFDESAHVERFVDIYKTLIRTTVHDS